MLIAMKKAGVATEKIPGVRGVRIVERDADKFLARQWPEVGPMPVTVPAAK